MIPFYDINAKLRYIKFCLLLFTFLFVLTGIALIIIGSTINEFYYEFMFFLRVDSVTPTTYLVFIGFLIFAVACVGLYGTLKSKAIVIGAFGGLLGLVCLLQLGAGVACHFLTGHLIDNLRTTMNETVWVYPYNDYAAQRMDAVQETLACCGMFSPKDWHQVYNGTEIPRSCCAFDDENSMCEYIHNTGCYTRLVHILKDSSRMLTTSSAVLAFMQLTGMAFAFYMAQSLRQQIRLRRDRKIMVTEQLLYSDADGTKSPI
ncbi:hypothetical protein GE061_013318 [Apolygus lucorum]|uniref:Tetraspanin n=1 Tax=Apolygus lucorum TaxID=248454 RepID=A0A6A4K6E5_APOLU|nr:hypothetical protein GE061_013318 [Apolygus lucorum]